MTQKVKDIVILILMGKIQQAKSLTEAEKLIDCMLEISKTEVEESEVIKPAC